MCRIQVVHVQSASQMAEKQLSFQRVFDSAINVLVWMFFSEAPLIRRLDGLCFSTTDDSPEFETMMTIKVFYQFTQTWCLYDGHHKDCDNANCNVNAMSMPKMGFLCKEGYTLHGVHSRIVVIPADTLQSESGQTKRSPSHFISVPTFKMMQSRPGVSFIPCGTFDHWNLKMALKKHWFCLSGNFSCFVSPVATNLSGWKAKSVGDRESLVAWGWITPRCQTSQYRD